MSIFDIFKKKENPPVSEEELLRQDIIRLQQLQAMPRDEAFFRQWNALMKELEKQPEPVRNRMAYECAKVRCTRDTSGFHGLSGGVIHVCGWADYISFPAEGGYPLQTQGVAFRIRRECFPEGPVRIYYSDDDDFGSNDTEKILQLIRQYSSGISNIHIERRVCTGWDDHSPEKERTCIVFDLDERAFHHTVVLNGRHVPTKELGGYVFMLPQCGEFYCVLGEIRDNVMIPLHLDDFCMK